jgi:hypothetical protein
MEIAEKIINENFYMFLGQYTSVSRIQESTQDLYYKVLSAQRFFFFKKKGIKFSKYENEIINLLDNSLHKFLYGSMALEQLWGVTHYLETESYGLPATIDINITIQQNEMNFLLSSLLDQSLYCWRSFLDFYLKYLLAFITGVEEINISTGKFRDHFKRYMNDNPNDTKAVNVFTYIESNVLNKTYNPKNGEECWGDLLRSLRDKTAHNKLITPTLMEKKNSKGFDIKWPKIKNMNYAELAQQKFQNKAYATILDLFPILYEIEWKPGPYKPGMYM